MTASTEGQLAVCHPSDEPVSAAVSTATDADLDETYADDLDLDDLNDEADDTTANEPETESTLPAPVQGETVPADADATDALAAADTETVQAAIEALSDRKKKLCNAGDSCYWDTASMAPLNARSAAAVARLRAYRPPAFALWDRLPISRRAAVLVLLYADRQGDLRVVLTMRAASLRNYSGHAAFPGGKADRADETTVQIARREAWEEIGLPLDDAQLPRPFRIEHLCELPYTLAKTELVVRPCIALLHRGNLPTESETDSPTDSPTDDVLMPKLDAKEVAAVFSAPFHNFLLAEDEVVDDVVDDDAKRRRPVLPPGPWYEGSWLHWHEKPWRLHFFYVPVAHQRVAKPKKRLPSEDAPAAKRPKTGTNKVGDKQKDEDEQKDEDGDENDIAHPGRYKVWGMTARIIVDAAKLAYGETPAFEHNSHFGDERVIEGLAKMGRLGDKKKPGSELTHEETKTASKM